MNKQGSKQYRQEIQTIHEELGISAGYASACGIDLQLECEELVETELDVFSRQPLMEVKAYKAWQAMKQDAQQVGVELQIISAYRNAEYQKNLFLNKIAKGQILSEVLKVNAAPGFSEHHSGQALDIACPDYEHLSEDFDQSPAFEWLSQHAGSYGFSLSFPKGNSAGFIYEPWHWRYTPL